MATTMGASSHPSSARPVRSRAIGGQVNPQPADSPPRHQQRRPHRLLPAVRDVKRWVSLAEHERRHGTLPLSRFSGREGGNELVELAAASGLRGRGGGGFPTALKIASALEATSRRRPAMVVANGCESDSTSDKDLTLLCHVPHLVLDGLVLAARALQASQAVLCVHRGSPAIPTLQTALRERRDDNITINLATVPRRYVASEASALTRFLSDGNARPTSSPPHTATRGVQGRPTLVDNVETLAHLALIARYGADWYRRRGTHHSPGTTLITIGGAVYRPGVFEVDLGTPIGDALTMAGGASQTTEAVLLGGLSGRWLATTPNLDTPLCYEGAQGVRLSLGSLVVLPADVCGLDVTSTILAYLARESAGQCGPCKFGLPAIASDFASLAAARPEATLSERMTRRLHTVRGRGACSHPDGAVNLAVSALDVFSSDVELHLTGQRCGRSNGSELTLLRTLPASAGGWI